MSKIQIHNLEDVELNVLRGVFPYVRLLDEDGRIIVSAKKTRGKSEMIRSHWAFIRNKLEREMPAGDYIIECAYDAAKKNVHQYAFTKTVDYVAPEPHIKPLGNTEFDANKFSQKMDKSLIDLIKQNAELSSENKFLMQQNGMLSERVKSLEQQVETLMEEHDEQPVALSEGERLLNAANQIIPVALPMLDKYFELQNKKLDLMYQQGRQQPQSHPAQGIPRKIPANRVQQNTQEQNQESEQQYAQQLAALDQLFNSGQDDEANGYLEQIAAVNPDLYNRICRDLNLEDA